MNWNSLELEWRGPTAWVWMNRPERHNAFDEVLIGELTELLSRLDQESDARVIVLAGRGKSFSAGADLAWMKRQGEATQTENLEDARRLARLFRLLAECGKPTIARVHGAGMGGGLGLAAACDICLASESAVFATSEVRLGLIPSVISPYVVRAIGARQSHRYFQTGERISAVRAREIGLVHEVSSPEKLDDLVQAVVDELLCGGPSAQAASTRLIRDVTSRPVTEALIDVCAKGIAEVRSSPEAREGLNAFLEKRVPSWKDS
ncbi:Short-chain-enoyl-CoA hydratase [compost metagenome]